MKEAYENAVAESERCTVKRDVEIKAEKARLIKEKFEKGEVIHSDDSDEEMTKKSVTKEDDMEVFEAGKLSDLFSELLFALRCAALRCDALHYIVH